MARKKITPQKLHTVIRNKIGQLSSKYSPSQKIDRTTYDLYNGFKNHLGIMSGKYINEICEALTEAGIKYNDSKIDKGYILVDKWQ